MYLDLTLKRYGKITYNGITQSISDWSEQLKVSKFAIRQRLKSGKSDYIALFGKSN